MQQGVRFDPDMPQTIRLEFAKSNTKVSKPKQPAAAAATSHPALMHPLTGRKYAPPLVHSLNTFHYLFFTHCTDYKVSLLLVVTFAPRPRLSREKKRNQFFFLSHTYPFTATYNFENYRCKSCATTDR